jgi:hypothetical protein
VPEASPVKSRVVPEGTATSERTMVAQEDFDLLADAAPLLPENVQVALRPRS